jgi:hypothetical protein
MQRRALRGRAPFERKLVAVVEAPNALLVETLFVDLEIGAE